MKTKLSSETTLGAEQLASIGMVAVEATYLEFHVQRLIERLLGIDNHPQSSLLTDRLGYAQKLDTLNELGRTMLQDDKQREEWSAYMANMRRLIEDRNVIIHGIWLLPQVSRTNPNPAPSAVRLRPKGVKTFESSDIRKVAEDIHLARMALEVFERGYLFPER